MIIKAVLLFFMLFNPADYRDFIQEGDEYYDNFDNINALKEYEKAYTMAPENYDVLFRLVRTFNDAGEEFKELKNRNEAEKYINKGMHFAEIFHQQYPDSAAVYTYLAMSYGNIAMFKGGKEKVSYAKKIEQSAKKAISISQSDHMPYIILGIYYRELASLGWIERTFANAFFGGIPEGSLEDSEKMFKKALAINPGIVVAVYQLSKTYREMDRKQDEEALLKKVLTMKELNFRDKFAKEKSKKRLAQK
jgi:tetratricopeptide (TPR) repeat protein